MCKEIKERRFAVELQRMFRSYVETALWASFDPETGENLTEFTFSDIALSTRRAMLSDCRNFLRDHRELIGDNLEQAGHDFFLTRNRHGVGFWDGDWPAETGSILTDASHVYGTFELWLCPGDEEITSHG